MSDPQRDDAKQWEGAVPAHGAQDEFRHWVLWGVGRPPDEEDGIDLTSVETGNEIAGVIAEQHDPEWGRREDRWVVVVEADEDEVDDFVQDGESVHGYAPYLFEAAVNATPARMQGTLRGDRVKRRPFR